VPWEETWTRLGGLPRSVFGTAAAHFGVGMMVVGIVATTGFQSEKVLVMKPGASVDIAGYSLQFRGTGPSRGPNYREEVGVFEVTRGGRRVATLNPAKRVYDQPPMPTTEAGIYNAWNGDLYVVLGDPQKDGGYAMRLYFNPFVRFIWIGALVMFFGGMLSLSDRRLRIGAPRRVAAKSGVVPAE
jgi:cytochrome c-type biogenesis protein CcmF